MPIASDDERLIKEISFFADRSDISEELTRLESHLAQFAHHLRKNEPVGRTLEFITQEIFANSTRWARRRMTPLFPSASSPAKRSWRKSASKSRTLNKQFSRYGILFVISAPSGAGKTTLVDALRQTPDSAYSVSCTTRPPRAGEIEGEDYHFLSESDFLARAKAGEFLEHATVHGHHYGTWRKPVLDYLKTGVDVLVDIDTQGAATIPQLRRRLRSPVSRRCLHYAARSRRVATPLNEARHRNGKANRAAPGQRGSREMELWRDYRYTIISKSMEEDLQKFRHIMGAERYLSRRLIQK